MTAFYHSRLIVDIMYLDKQVINWNSFKAKFIWNSLENKVTLFTNSSEACLWY